MDVIMFWLLWVIPGYEFPHVPNTLGDNENIDFLMFQLRCGRERFPDTFSSQHRANTNLRGLTKQYTRAFKARRKPAN